MRAPSEVGIFNVSIEDPIARVQDYMDGYRLDRAYDGPDRLLFHHMKIVSARRTDAGKDGMEAHVVIEMDVFPEICNSMGNMHGGAVAMLVDNTTTLAQAPLAKEGSWNFGGVSRTLQVTYLKPMPVYSTIVIENMVRSAGKTLAAIQCTIRDKATGRLLALGEHGKAAMTAEARRKAVFVRL